MYLDHFGLTVNPFGLSPKLDFLYKSSAFEESMAHLVYGLDNSEAIVLITGSIGTGKTMALQSFLSHLGEQFAFALVTNTRVNSVELLKLILEDLDVEFPMGADKSDLLILFKGFLLESSRQGKRVLLAVDEAQNLSRDVLEEVRLLTNLGQGEGQPVQIILLGQPELEDLLNREDLAQLKQRIRVHYRLAFLTRPELQEYLDHRMRVAGCESSAFSKGAVDRIFKISKGVPRVVNTVAGEALLSAFVAGHKVVEPGDVEEPGEAQTIPEPRPELAPPPPVQPVAPPPPPPAAPTPQPSARQPDMAVRAQPGSRPKRTGWVIAAILAAILGAAYMMGYLDGPLAYLAADRLPTSSPTGPVETASQPSADPGLVAVDGQNPSEFKPVENTAVADTAAEVIEQTQDVEPESVEPEDVDPEATLVAKTAPASDFGFFIHVSSFRAPDRAENMVTRLTSRGLVAVERRQTVSGTEWFRVFVGPYADRSSALAQAQQLVDEDRISYYKIVRLSTTSGS